MIESPSPTVVSEPTDLLAMNQGRWKREPIVAEALPIEAYPLYARMYAELAEDNVRLGNRSEESYCRQMVAKFGGQP